MSDELDEQKQQEWQARIAQKRLDLSRSVEETLVDTSLLDDWSDEAGRLDSSPGTSRVGGVVTKVNSKNTTIILPRLTLQSKPMPIVHADVPAQPREASSPPLPAVDPAPYKPRLAGRVTKVLLKAIDRSEESPKSLEVGEPLREETTSAYSIDEAEAVGDLQLPQVPHEALHGSGMFRRGQSDVTIGNTNVTHSCVIHVMLTSDPGPMVVHYVSLVPQQGFTVHLSAPAERDASFNYVMVI